MECREIMNRAEKDNGRKTESAEYKRIYAKGALLACLILMIPIIICFLLEIYGIEEINIAGRISLIIFFIWYLSLMGVCRICSRFPLDQIRKRKSRRQASQQRVRQRQTGGKMEEKRGYLFRGRDRGLRAIEEGSRSWSGAPSLQKLQGTVAGVLFQAEKRENDRVFDRILSAQGNEGVFHIFIWKDRYPASGERDFLKKAKNQEAITPENKKGRLLLFEVPPL